MKRKKKTEPQDEMTTWLEKMRSGEMGSTITYRGQDDPQDKAILVYRHETDQLRLFAARRRYMPNRNMTPPECAKHYSDRRLKEFGVI